MQLAQIFLRKDLSCKMLHKHRSFIHLELLCLKLQALCMQQLAKLVSVSSAVLIFVWMWPVEIEKLPSIKYLWLFTFLWYHFDSMGISCYCYITEVAKGTWCTTLSFVFIKLSVLIVTYIPYTLKIPLLFCFYFKVGLAQLAFKRFTSCKSHW